MKASSFEKAFLETVSPTQQDSPRSERAKAQLLLQMKQSYGTASNKWNQLENSRDLSALFRFDLEKEALAYEDKKIEEEKENEQIREQLIQERIQRIRAESLRQAEKQRKLETRAGLKPVRRQRSLSPSHYQLRDEPPNPPIVVKDWRYFNAVTPDQKHIWNKKDMMTPIMVYCNERPHLTQWAKEKEEERRLMEIEAERREIERKAIKIQEIREKDREAKAKLEAKEESLRLPFKETKKRQLRQSQKMRSFTPTSTRRSAFAGTPTSHLAAFSKTTASYLPPHLQQPSLADAILNSDKIVFSTSRLKGEQSFNGEDSYSNFSNYKSEAGFSGQPQASMTLPPRSSHTVNSYQDLSIDLPPSQYPSRSFAQRYPSSSCSASASSSSSSMKRQNIGRDSDEKSCESSSDGEEDVELLFDRQSGFASELLKTPPTSPAAGTSETGAFSFDLAASPSFSETSASSSDTFSVFPQRSAGSDSSANTSTPSDQSSDTDTPTKSIPPLFISVPGEQPGEELHSARVPPLSPCAMPSSLPILTSANQSSSSPSQESSALSEGSMAFAAQPESLYSEQVNSQSSLAASDSTDGKITSNVADGPKSSRIPHAKVVAFSSASSEYDENQPNEDSAIESTSNQKKKKLLKKQPQRLDLTSSSASLSSISSSLFSPNNQDEELRPLSVQITTGPLRFVQQYEGEEEGGEGKGDAYVDNKEAYGAYGKQKSKTSALLNASSKGKKKFKGSVSGLRDTKPLTPISEEERQFQLVKERDKFRELETEREWKAKTKREQQAQQTLQGQQGQEVEDGRLRLSSRDVLRMTQQDGFSTMAGTSSAAASSPSRTLSYTSLGSTPSLSASSLQYSTESLATAPKARPTSGYGLRPSRDEPSVLEEEIRQIAMTKLKNATNNRLRHNSPVRPSSSTSSLSSASKTSVQISPPLTPVTLTTARSNWFSSLPTNESKKRFFGETEKGKRLLMQLGEMHNPAPREILPTTPTAEMAAFASSAGFSAFSTTSATQNHSLRPKSSITYNTPPLSPFTSVAPTFAASGAANSSDSRPRSAFDFSSSKSFSSSSLARDRPSSNTLRSSRTSLHSQKSL
ncbi:uncharacterized protein MONOS_6020 [Monocercomonoides exilis]|uniref:uncharacterized protein n=1 Tax=Monocercomonoides exilis TaxID=2049356 RepID=UPI00355AAB87|nr:hypothetical protein MONOS_6020 [Monocercomonoides exilis]|eukprot:MONOS_6020.1-p1 / transcript=MONOS_6020.1 / gene=MONOS_6020 / organism=Monocercomonoides_exilis_PA203 / gene_product=unspecified product / transcript_product=unspecified product / location=Mono_scaffold00184:12827-16412(-) / protein_length=1090 / sequence_SO=supercontig / SO=protein_coding / is_pseudo=false